MRGGYASAYTPKETVSYENLVKYIYQSEVGKSFGSDQPIRVLIVALFEIPKSTSKKRAELMRAGEIRPTKGGRGNPDLDNIAKAICDALNGIAYHDDAQVVDLKVVKYYSDTPCVTVTIEEVTGNDTEGNGS
jgi:Holliday junction resolvase RusA-like endonuclease